MQEIYHDGTEGEPKTADTLEELIPEIKKALKNPLVSHVKLFIPGRNHSRALKIARMEVSDAYSNKGKKHE